MVVVESGEWHVTGTSLYSEEKVDSADEVRSAEEAVAATEETG